MKIPPALLEEFDQHGRHIESYITKQLREHNNPDLVATVTNLIRVFSNYADTVPPDSITAQALRLIADGFDHANKQIGNKDPSVCEMYRAALRAKTQSSNHSVWEDE